MRVAVPLAYVRLEDGQVAALEEGATVPDNADPGHVAELLSKDVLVDDDEGDVDKGGDTPDPAPTPPTPAKKADARPGPPRGGSSS